MNANSSLHHRHLLPFGGVSRRAPLLPHRPGLLVVWSSLVPANLSAPRPIRPFNSLTAVINFACHASPHLPGPLSQQHCHPCRPSWGANIQRNLGFTVSEQQEKRRALQPALKIKSFACQPTPQPHRLLASPWPRAASNSFSPCSSAERCSQRTISGNSCHFKTSCAVASESSSVRAPSPFSQA